MYLLYIKQLLSSMNIWRKKTWRDLHRKIKPHLRIDQEFLKVKLFFQILWKSTYLCYLVFHLIWKITSNTNVLTQIGELWLLSLVSIMKKDYKTTFQCRKNLVFFSIFKMKYEIVLSKDSILHFFASSSIYAQSAVLYTQNASCWRAPESNNKNSWEVKSV